MIGREHGRRDPIIGPLCSVPMGHGSTGRVVLCERNRKTPEKTKAQSQKHHSNSSIEKCWLAGKRKLSPGRGLLTNGKRDAPQLSFEDEIKVSKAAESRGKKAKKRRRIVVGRGESSLCEKVLPGEGEGGHRGEGATLQGGGETAPKGPNGWSMCQEALRESWGKATEGQEFPGPSCARPGQSWEGRRDRDVSAQAHRREQQINEIGRPFVEIDLKGDL